MASNQAVLDDLTARALRPLTDLEQAWAATRLGDAFTQILTVIPGAGTRLDNPTFGDPFPALVVQVQCQMVLRVLANPDGILEETVDDYTRRLDGTTSTGSLYLTDSEQALLTDGLTTGTSTGGRGAFSVRAVPASPAWPSW